MELTLICGSPSLDCVCIELTGRGISGIMPQDWIIVCIPGFAENYNMVASTKWKHPHSAEKGTGADISAAKMATEPIYSRSFISRLR